MAVVGAGVVTARVVLGTVVAFVEPHSAEIEGPDWVCCALELKGMGQSPYYWSL